ncbi:MAG: energy transducer TonB [Bacteroidetes bacterium]|nr:energy transducer TonB [Bacteroidota bacterium]
MSPPIVEESSEIYEVVDVDKSPELIGGYDRLQRYVRYPKSCRRENIEGDVTVQFIVDEHGSVLKPSIQQGIGGSCDEAIIRVMAKRAKYTPGYLDGRAVKVRMSLTVYFRLR